MEYAFRSIGRTCAATGAELTPGTLCRSALVERDGRFERLDFVLSAWTDPPADAIGHWRCRIPAAVTPQVRHLDADTLLQEFERLEETGHEQVLRLRYVLALLLLQKKRLELEDCRAEEETNFLVLIGTKGEGPFEVRDEQLSADEIAVIQRELLTQLSEQKLHAPSSSADPVEPAETTDLRDE
jgi:hypothetical protein